MPTTMGLGGDRRSPQTQDWEGALDRRRRMGFLAIMGIVYCLGAAKTLVFAKVLGSSELAYYGLVLVVLQVGVQLAQWGIMAGLNVELPTAYGRGEGDMSNLIERGLGAVIAASLLSATVYLIMLNAIGPANPNVRIALSLAAATTFFTIITEFAILLLRAQRRLIHLAGVYMTRNVLVVALGAGAAAAWGYRGAILGEIAALCLAVLIWRVDLRPQWPDWKVTRFLLRTGGPLLASVSIVTASFLVDRLFVAGALPDQFGQYTFASVVLAAAISVQATINQIVPPQLFYERGAGRSLGDLLQRLTRFVLWILGLGAVGFALLLALISLTRDSLFSEYSAGLDVMPILYIGAVLALASIYEVELIAARRLRLVVAINAIGLLAATAAAVVVTLTGPSLTAYAWVFVLGRAVCAVGLGLTAFWIARTHPDERVAVEPEPGRGSPL